LRKYWDLKMKILSLFDGCSCGRVALERVGISVEAYYASEIDKHAEAISRKNYPDIIRLGDIKDITQPPKCDLVIGGSPCTSLSIAARQKESGLEKGESTLFWEFIRVLKLMKPEHFLFENVASMKKTDRDKISEILGVEPVMINSALVSAQQRKRLYWANFPITQPCDKGLMLKDILQDGYSEREKSLCLTATDYKASIQQYLEKGARQMVFTKPIRVANYSGKNSQGYRVYSVDGKSVTLASRAGGLGAKTGLYEVLKGYGSKLTPVEAERLQTLPDNYTEGVSATQRCKMIGNGFTVDVIVHILMGINKT
jgi:DNA (cytosine-5)-methyltransferase 3A